VRDHVLAELLRVGPHADLLRVRVRVRVRARVRARVRVRVRVRVGDSRRP